MSFSSLFGTAKGKIDATIESLFKSDDAPVSRDQLKHTRSDISVRRSRQVEDVVEAEEEQPKKRAKKSKLVDEDEKFDLEGKYFDKVLGKEIQPEKEEEENVDEDVLDDSDSDEEQEETEGTTEGETKEGDADVKKPRTKKATTIDLKETQLEQAEKTIFVGNVSSTAISLKTVYKTFKKLFKQYGKVELIRFRSIAFDDALPRKVAFAKKSLHKLRESCNAYIVFAEKEASLKAVKSNATIFEELHLRVDHVAHPAQKDNRRTIFVGNLDFEEKEESLWRYFNSKTDNDVESVRVIRDSKTNVGKGFALIQFKDTLSVNKALQLHDLPLVKEDGLTKSGAKKMKNGRKLRISRAKTYAKPSTMSPNHIDNQKKNLKKTVLSDNQKTKLGRAQRVLGKADRSTAGNKKKVGSVHQSATALEVNEGSRAQKGASIAGIKGLKSAKGRVKKPRIRDRSSNFKSERDQMAKELKPKEAGKPRDGRSEGRGGRERSQR